MPTVSRFFLPALIALAFVVSGSEAEAKKKTAADLVATADVIATKVAKLRGLKLKEKIRRGVMSKAQIKKRILKLLHTEYTDAELDAESLAMKRFGLIPESSDYVKIMVGLLEEQIAGFYDPAEKKLYIAGWAPMGGDMLMAHEIDHALQDQHFDLKKFMEADKKNGDSMAARQALVEGDGMALMLEFQMASMKQAPPWGNPFILKMLKKSMSKELGGMKQVPLAMREGLVFPYIGGLEFVAHFRKHHPWSSIDAIYKKPPLSTEQILHPDKYESYERPVKVTASLPASLKGYSETVTSVQGEKGIELFLRSHGVKQERAIRAAAGWGGDRIAVYAARGHKGSRLANTVGVSYSTWDDESEAEEFFEALEHALPKLSGKSRHKRSDKVLQFAIGKGGVLLAERKGDKVLILIDAPKATAERLRGEVWTSWSATPAPPAGAAAPAAAP
jgi:hypothetical protein